MFMKTRKAIPGTMSSDLTNAAAAKIKNRFKGDEISFTSLLES
jgi:hypothetical protein